MGGPNSLMGGGVRKRANPMYCICSRTPQCQSSRDHVHTPRHTRSSNHHSAANRKRHCLPLAFTLRLYLQRTLHTRSHAHTHTNETRMDTYGSHSPPLSIYLTRAPSRLADTRHARPRLPYAGSGIVHVSRRRTTSDMKEVRKAGPILRLALNCLLRSRDWSSFSMSSPARLCSFRLVF